MRLLLLLLLLVTSLMGSGQAKTQGQVDRVLREGDLLFQHIGGIQGEALRLATRSPWTHVGIAFMEQGQWMVLEAVGPVKLTPLEEWIDQGNNEYTVRRLKARVLTDIDINQLREAAKPFMGLAYDQRFLWNNDEIYCSELVWKLYAIGLGIELCAPRPLRDFDLGSSQVRKVMLERFGGAPPLDEPMVAPSTLIACPLLIALPAR